MTQETTKVRLWQLQARESAIQFSTMPPGDQSGRLIWLPRSQILHVSRDAPLPGGWVPCTVDLPLWLAEARDL